MQGLPTPSIDVHMSSVRAGRVPFIIFRGFPVAKPSVSLTRLVTL